VKERKKEGVCERESVTERVREKEGGGEREKKKRERERERETSGGRGSVQEKMLARERYR